MKTNSDNFYALYAARCFAVGGSLTATLATILTLLIGGTAMLFLRQLGASGVFILTPIILVYTFGCADMIESTGTNLLRHRRENEGASQPGDFDDDTEDGDD